MREASATIMRFASRFCSGTLLSRFTGMLRDIALAYAFGTHSAIASFLVAFRLAHLFRRLIGEGALHAAFIPIFEEKRTDHLQKALSFFRDTYLLLFLLLLGIIGLGTAGITLALPYTSSATYELLSYTRLLLPSLLFICLFGLNSALLHCQKSFFLPASAPVAFNLTWIAAALLLRTQNPTQAMPSLAIAVTFACCLQWASTLPPLLTLLKKERSPRTTWPRLTENAKKLLKPMTLGIIGIGASQINSALDALFAWFADAEGPAFLWYAIRLQQLPLALFGVAIASALFPSLTRSIKQKDPETYHYLLQTSTTRTLQLMLPITLFFLLYGSLCINLLFGRGQFSSSSIQQTTYCLWGYSLGLIPMTYILIAARALYAQGDYKIPTQGALLSLSTNVLCNSLCIGVFHGGAASVAAATSLSSWVHCLWLLSALAQKPAPYNCSLFCLPNTPFLLANACALLTCLFFKMAPQASLWPTDFPHWLLQLGKLSSAVLLFSSSFFLGYKVFSYLSLRKTEI